MKLKNSIIKSLVENGLDNTTDHDLSAAHAYKVFKFKDEIAKAYKEIEGKRQKLVKDILGEDFDAKRKEAKEGTPEYDELNEKFTKFIGLYNELMDDESEVNIKTIPFEEYHLLARENKQTAFQVAGADGKPVQRVIDFFSVFRSVLKDVLWVEPKEED